MHANKKISYWCYMGFIAIVILGSALHFVFDWSNHQTLVGLIVPVNESVWEHLKMGYLGIILFSIIEYFLLKETAKNYFLAKALGITILNLTILVTFYSYTAFTHKNILWIDISSFVVGALLCQIFAYKLFNANSNKNSLNYLSLIYIIGVGILFGLFTHHPPHKSIFMDHNDKTYGIFREK